MQTLTFTKKEYNYVLKKSTEFANKEYETSKKQRAKRNQNNKQRIIQQNITGKIGEFAVMFHFLDQGRDINSPDMEIYTYKKSFDADLTLDGVGLHVKSQSKDSYDRLGKKTWTFQYGGSGSGHKDPLTYKKSTENVVFVYIDAMNTEIYGPYSWDIIKPLLKDPVIDRLKGIKKCIYAEDLPV